ncbi:hypothetical protein ACLBXM_04745 [Xanthobacteraceae bacterium A53D]
MVAAFPALRSAPLRRAGDRATAWGMTGNDDKAARLAAALRANLARRKTQKRARAAEADSSTPATSEPDTAAAARDKPSGTGEE